MKGARYLYFPCLSWKGREQGALFMTYMAGPIHGGVDAEFIGNAQAWKKQYPAIKRAMASGCSSGAYNAVQPDYRIFPYKKFRDRNGNDVDRAHDGLPHSRMYWEVECDHRDVVGLREHGAKLMNRSKYTRLFLGASISKPDKGDSSYEAAIVLWGKDITNDTITVRDAVSFGTRDLSDEAKQSWREHRANRLPAVVDWRRPANADATPEEVVSPTPVEWLLKVPFAGLLLNVMTGKRNSNGEHEYFLDALDGLEDIEIDLLELSFTIWNKSPAGEEGQSSDNEEEDP